MQLLKRLIRLEAEMLPKIEQRKQQYLLWQQQSTEIHVKRDVKFYQGGAYHIAETRERLGIHNPYLDAIDRYWKKREPVRVPRSPSPMLCRFQPLKRQGGRLAQGSSL